MQSDDQKQITAALMAKTPDLLSSHIKAALAKQEPALLGSPTLKSHVEDKASLDKGIREHMADAQFTDTAHHLFTLLHETKQGKNADQEQLMTDIVGYLLSQRGGKVDKLELYRSKVEHHKLSHSVEGREAKGRVAEEKLEELAKKQNLSEKLEELAKKQNPGEKLAKREFRIMPTEDLYEEVFQGRASQDRLTRVALNVASPEIQTKANEEMQQLGDKRQKEHKSTLDKERRAPSTKEMLQEKLKKLFHSLVKPGGKKKASKAKGTKKPKSAKPSVDRGPTTTKAPASATGKDSSQSFAEKHRSSGRTTDGHVAAEQKRSKEQQSSFRST